MHTCLLTVNLGVCSIQEVWKMAPCPSREDLLATLHTEGAGRQTTLWRLTGLGEERASSALRPLEQLVTLSPREEGAGGSQFGSVLWNPEGPQTVLGPVTLHCLSLSLSVCACVCLCDPHTFPGAGCDHSRATTLHLESTRERQQRAPHSHFLPCHSFPHTSLKVLVRRLSPLPLISSYKPESPCAETFSLATHSPIQA